LNDYENRKKEYFRYYYQSVDSYFNRIVRRFE